MKVDPVTISVIAPNFKKRLSGVTSTIVRLVPLQAQDIAIAATGPGLPGNLPHIPLRKLLTMSRRGPDRARRVWHARRNVEMLGGLALKHIARKDLALLFTSASQRNHSWLTRWLINQMDAVVATSDKSAAYLKVPSTTIRHGIDTQVFQPSPNKAAFRARLGLPQDGLLIGCFGRIRPSKGTDIFVDAMRQVLPDHPDVTAIVMGRAVDKDQPFLQALKDKVTYAKLSDRILFLPEVPADATADWYGTLDLYIAPQRWEGFGLTPLEAMATTAPVIATRVGAFEEIVTTGETGLLIDADDTDAMVAATHKMLADPDKLARMGQNARQHVTDHFALAGEAAALINIYRSLLAQ